MNTSPIYNPANGEPLATLGQASQHDVELAVESAKKGFEVWSEMTAVERSRILLKAVAILRREMMKFRKARSLDTGKPLQEAICVDIQTGADVIEYFAGLAPTLQGEQQPLGTSQFFATRRGEPLGICAFGIGLGITRYKSRCGNLRQHLPQEMS